MFEKLKINQNDFSHFDFSIKGIGKETLEKEINECLDELINNGEDTVLVQGQYLIIGKKYADGEINIYFSTNFYSAILFPEYKSVDWIEDNEE